MNIFQPSPSGLILVVLGKTSPPYHYNAELDGTMKKKTSSTIFVSGEYGGVVSIYRLIFDTLIHYHTFNLGLSNHGAYKCLKNTKGENARRRTQRKPDGDYHTENEHANDKNNACLEAC